MTSEKISDVSFLNATQIASYETDSQAVLVSSFINVGDISRRRRAIFYIIYFQP